jgi:hypothetical protein
MASPDKIIHRVKVLNLPPKDTVPIKKLFNAHGILKYKKAPQWNYAYINFDVRIFISVRAVVSNPHPLVVGDRCQRYHGNALRYGL